MDSDVLLVQNLAPMLEEDWAVLMYADFVNPAALLRKVRDCEGYHGMVIKPHKFNQRKLGSYTSELRTNRTLRLEMMKGGMSSNNI